MTITDPVQARLLAHPEFGRIMDALLGRELSIKAVAEELNLPLDAVHYRVKKLMCLSLVRVVRQEKRAGRAIKIYSATASEFFIPYSSFTHATLEDKFLTFEAQLSRVLVRSRLRLMRDTFGDAGKLGPRIYRNEQGWIAEDLAVSPAQSVNLLAPDFPAVVDEVIDLRLPFTQAKALQAELHAISRRYAPHSPTETGDQPYALRLTLLPVNPADLQ